MPLAAPAAHRRALARLLVLVTFVALAAIGAPTAGAAPTGTTTGTTTVYPFQAAGVNGSFRLHVPDSLPANAAVPLVLMLHGGASTGFNAEQQDNWDQQADQSHFVVAYPDGPTKSWNGGDGCCGIDEENDVGFLEGVVHQVEDMRSVDANRVYVAGISLGGIMAYRLACQSSLFAAVGPDAATQLAECANRSPLSVIHIHGTADDRIHYDGTPGDGRLHIDGPSVPKLHRFWRDTDVCPQQTMTTNGRVTTYDAPCEHGREVELIRIAGGGHVWPGANCPATPTRCPGSASPVEATPVMWRFFAAHPKTA